MDITDAIKLPGAKLQIQISEETPQGRYNDCLYYTEKEVASLTEEQVTADKQARVTNWCNFVTEQSKKPPVKPTKAELQEHKDSLKAQMDSIDAQLVAIDVKPKGKEIVG